MFACQILVKEVNKTIFFAENNAVMSERYYVESLKETFYMGIQSKSFGFNRNIYIEVGTCEYHDKNQNAGIN